MAEITRLIAFFMFVMAVCLPNAASAYTLKRTSDGKQVRWHKQRVSLRIDGSLERMLPNGQARAAAIMASEAWRGLPGVPDISIEEGAPRQYDPGRRGNAIYLLAEWPHDPSYLAVTIVTFKYSGEIIGVDVLINAQKHFAELLEGEDRTISSDHDLASVLTHELGHVLGLGESHDNEDATMWPYGRAGDMHQRSLSVDDEDAVVEAYSEELPVPACSVSAPIGRNGAAGEGMLTFFLAVAIGTRVLLRKTSPTRERPC